MLRSLLLGATAAVTMSTTAAMADNKSDCQNGVAMIEAELKKEHSEVVLEALRKVLSIAELKVEDQAWSECIKYIEFVCALLTPTLIDRAIEQQSIPGATAHCRAAQRPLAHYRVSRSRPPAASCFIASGEGCLAWGARFIQR